MIDIKQFDGKAIAPRDDALLYDFIVAHSGMFEGCEITSLGANQLRISSGRGIIRGRVFVVEEEIILAELSGSGTQKGRLLIRVDVSNSGQPISFVTQVAATLPALVQEDINRNGAVFELPLATYNVNEVQLSGLSVVDNQVTAPFPQPATSTAFGTVKLSDSTSSTLSAASGKTAATPAAVKSANDAAKSVSDALAATRSDLAPKSFSIPTSAWVTSSEISGYGFAAEITVSGVSATDRVDVAIDKSRITSAISAGMLPGAFSSTNTFTLYSKSQPTVTITGSYVVFKGA